MVVRRQAGVALALAWILSACGGASTGTTVASLDGGAGSVADASVAVDAEEAMLEFAACMRDQGLDFPDPEPDDDGTLRFVPPRALAADGEVNREALDAAREACQPILDAADLGFGPGRGGNDDFDAETFLAFASCMRAQGIEDFPDPGADGRPDREAMQALDLDSDAFQAASATCADEVGFQAPAGGPGGGPGGGPPRG